MESDPNQYADSLDQALKVWQPVLDSLASLCLQFGLKRSDLETSKAWQAAFLSAASERYKSEHGKSPTIQQAALLAGLQRKLAAQLLKGLPAPQPRYTTAVLHYWITRPPYCKNGKPQPLPLKGLGSFESLCIRVCGELGYRNALKELVTSGAVRIDGDIAYLTKTSLIANDVASLTTLQFVSKSIEGLANAIHHNLSDTESKHPQKVTWTEELPSELEPGVMAEIREILDHAFERVREVVRTAEQADSPTGKHHLAVGLYAHSKPLPVGKNDDD